MPDSKLGSIVFLLSLVLPIVTILAYTNHRSGKQVVSVPKVQADEPQNSSFPVTVTTPVREVGSASLSEQAVADESEEIDAYIRMVFGKDADMAIQVQRHECSPQHKMYPSCRLTSQVEDSVGIFQINIESATTKVHWAKIPGETKQEKVEWLMEPRNNTLMAYFIFSRAGNFCAWTWYKNNYCN